MSVAAIVLAAGASRRLGRPKQLLLLEGETLLGRTLRLASLAGAAPMIAVLGANCSAIRATVPLEDAIVAVNENWEQGLASSIHTGVLAAEASDTTIAGVILMICDQPRLNVNHLLALISTFEAQTTPTIIASAYAGILGIPAVFPRDAFPGLLALRGDHGARALIARPPCPVVSLPFVGGEVDIDLPIDLPQLE